MRCPHCGKNIEVKTSRVDRIRDALSQVDRVEELPIGIACELVGMPPRASFVLEQAEDIKTVSDVIGSSLRLPNCGRKTVDEIRDHIDVLLAFDALIRKETEV